MTRVETANILAILRVAYPNFYKEHTPADAEFVLRLWGDLFEGDSFAVVSSAVKTLIATREVGYPPAIGEIKSMVDELSGGNMTAQEAWAIAAKAAAGNIRFEALPEDIRKAIGSKEMLREWGLMDSEVFNSVIYSQFLKSYEITLRRKKAVGAPSRQSLGSQASMFAIEGGV